jgi:hypothetical protein
MQPKAVDQFSMSLRVLQRAFEQVGIPYCNPHSFRHAVVPLGKDRCKTWAATQAWAQNPGHESPTTTFGSCGKFATHDQDDPVRNAGKRMQDTQTASSNEIKSMIAQLQPPRASTGS